MQNDHPVMDGVSNFHLPEPVIHTIFSFLSPEDAIRASVLSKQWRSAWISSPIFSFDEGTLPFKNSDFIDYVDRSLALWRDRCDGMLNMEKLSLSAAINDGESFSRLVQVFAFATSHNVKAIELKNCAGILWIISDLNALWPLLCACKSLDVLSLELFILFFLNSLPKTSCLRKLTLTCIKIDDNSLCNLLASFPFLEDLAIEYCYGFTELNVSLSNLRKLKMISYDNLASKVVIEAENLQSFYYDRCFNCPGTITFSNSKSLTSLHIEQCKFLTASALDEIISRIPILENLTLEWCVWPDVIRITHSNLKSLRLPEGLGDGKAEINTPNLRFFSYSGAMDLFSTFRYSSGILNANLVFGTRNTEWFWYIKLRNFLECFSECNMVKLTCYLEVISIFRLLDVVQIYMYELAI